MYCKNEVNLVTRETYFLFLKHPYIPAMVLLESVNKKDTLLPFPYKLPYKLNSIFPLLCSRMYHVNLKQNTWWCRSTSRSSLFLKSSDFSLFILGRCHSSGDDRPLFPSQTILRGSSPFGAPLNSNFKQSLKFGSRNTTASQPWTCQYSHTEAATAGVTPDHTRSSELLEVFKNNLLI